MVECFLAKEDVAGSTPVSRSKNPLPAVHFTYNSEGLQVNSPPEARYPSGKGEVCKTFMRRFDPDPRLQNFLLSNQWKQNTRKFHGKTIHVLFPEIALEAGQSSGSGGNISISRAPHGATVQERLRAFLREAMKSNVH